MLKASRAVLILILLEYGLRQSGNALLNKEGKVLILILLEYGLRLVEKMIEEYSKDCLNPYSTGIWSATPKIANH